MFLVISFYFVYKFSICLHLPGRKQHTPRFALLGQSNNLHKNIAKSSIKKRRVKRGRTKHTEETWEGEGRQHRMLYRTGTEHNKRWLRKCANGKVKVQRTTHVHTLLHSLPHLSHLQANNKHKQYAYNKATRGKEHKNCQSTGNFFSGSLLC